MSETQRSTGRVGNDSQPLPAHINDSDQWWWKLSLSLLFTVVFKLLLFSPLFHINHYMKFLSCCVNTPIWFYPADPCFGVWSFIFLWKYRTGWEKYNITAYSQGANQILICCSNSAAVGWFLFHFFFFLRLKTKLMHRLTAADDSRRRSSKPTLQLL